MSIFSQVGIGLGAVCIIMWLVLILGKKKVIRGYIYAGFMTLVCALVLVVGLSWVSEEPKESSIEMSAEDMICFANALANYGVYDEAREIIALYSEEYGYDEECSLLNARMDALQGNYEQAAGIYNRLQKNEQYTALIAEESKSVIAKASVNLGELGVINYLASEGKDLAAYGYSQAQADSMREALKISEEAVSGEISDAMKENYDIDKYEDILNSVSEAERVYIAYGAMKYEDLSEDAQKEIKTVKKDLEKAIQKCEDMADFSFARDALLKLRLMQGEYDEIAECIDENATYTELVVVSRLYQKNAVKDKDFAEEYINGYINNNEPIYERLTSIYEETSDELTTLEKKELKSYIETWKLGTKYPALVYIKSTLQNKVSAGEVGSESSKVYLELAQVEHFLQNASERKNRISDALTYGYESEDEEYKSAITKINNIVNNTEDISAVMNVGSYVQEVMKNAIPMETYDLLPDEEIVDEDKHNDGDKDQGQGAWGKDDEEDAEDSEDVELQDFESAFTDDVSTLMNSLDISSVDTTNFETIEVYISLSEDLATNSKELEKILSVYDCGFEIENFELEKVEYGNLRTYLLCDVSGSMSGSMEDLRSAVTDYISAKSSKEEVAISTFSDYIRATVDFGATDEELLNFVSGMYDGGGTAIVSSTIEVLEKFSSANGDKQVLIVMTDGQDGYGYSAESIMTEIGSLAEEKNVTVHTIGLGSVDADYLNTIAASGNGIFVYVSDSASLSSFYDLLHGQVDNQYKITFKAEDTMTLMNRKLEVKVQDSAVQDTFIYSIGEQEEADGEGEDEEALDVTTLSVSGLKTRFIYKGKEDIDNVLLGSGFTPESYATLTLVGEEEYTIPLQYESSTEYKLTIPATVEVGNYDLVVNIGSKKAQIMNGLVVAQEEELQTAAFGPYRFTSARMVVDGDTYLLSGNVTMNGWLRFKGEVKLTGDLAAGRSITVEDYSGSYVMFDSADATGLGAYFASKGIYVDVPAMGRFELHYDEQNLYDYEEYKVSDIYSALMYIQHVAAYDSLTLHLYPDRLELLYSEFHTEFPSLEDIFDTGDSSIFDFEAEGKGILNSQNIGIEFEGEAGFNNEQYCKVNMMNSPVLLNKAGIKAKINTWSEEYEFSGEVDLAVVDLGVGASVGLKKTQVDSFSVTLDFPVTVTMGGVPVTFSQFMLGAEDIADAVEKKNFKAVTIKGGMKISACDISEICPPLEEFVGDISLLALDETEFKLRLQPMMFQASTELKLLEQITLAKGELQIGTFEYSNGLLGLSPTEVSGLRAEVKKGFMWELDNLKFDISATGKLNALSRFFGVELNGMAKMEASWWWFNVDLEESGDLLMGVYVKENGAKQFTIIVEYEHDPLIGNPYTKRHMFYLDEKGNFQHDKEKVTL